MLAEATLAIVLTLVDGRTLRCEQVHIEVGQVACFNDCGHKRDCDGSLFCRKGDLIPSQYIKDINTP